LRKETFAIQFFRAIVSRASRNKLARIHPRGERRIDLRQGIVQYMNLNYREPGGSRCRISLKSHRPLHDCSVLREAFPPAGQNATTFSLIWHGTLSCRIEEPDRFSLFLCGPMRELDSEDFRRNVFHEDSLRGLEKRREDKAREKRSRGQATVSRSQFLTGKSVPSPKISV